MGTVIYCDTRGLPAAYTSGSSYFHTHNTVCLAIIGYLIILACFIVATIIDEEDAPMILTVCLMFVGGCLNCATGIICLIRYLDSKGDYGGGVGTWLELGLVTIATGVLLLIDSIFLMMDK